MGSAPAFMYTAGSSIMWRRILLIFGYLLLILAVVGVTVALVYSGKGYTYNFTTKKFVQTGLIIINSIPNGLPVDSDGKPVKKKKTPFREPYEPGNYDFSLSKDGYYPWSKRLESIPGEVTLAQYVILVPKSPKVTVLDTKPLVVAQAISRDHRHLAYITAGPEAALYTLDLTNTSAKAVKLYVPKAAAGTVPAEVLGSVTWSDDASHLLIASMVGPDPVHRLATASGGEPVNLTEKFRFNLTGLTFSGNNWRRLYWISPDGLRRIDAEAQTVSAVLADKVVQFLPAGDRMLYIQESALGRALWSLDSRDNHQELVPALVESDTYAMAYSSFNSQDQLAIVPAKTKTGTLYSDIFGTTPVAKTLARDVTGVSFSPDGHYVAFTSATEMKTFDLERSQIDNKLIIYGSRSDKGDLVAMTWYDSSHLLVSRGGHLYWSDYDGSNVVDLGVVVAGLPGNGVSDGRSVVAFRPEGQNVRVIDITIKP